MSQDLLQSLGRMYRGRGIQRDAFGRRTALPSEVARVLATNETDPPASTSWPGSSTSDITSPPSVHFDTDED
jgi:hypothetical protein